MKKVVLTVEDRGIDYRPVIDYLAENHLMAEWRPLMEQTSEELFHTVKDADAVIAGVEKWDAGIMSKLSPKLKVIARYGIGYDSVDVKAARSLGIAVTNTPEVLSEAVAELTLGLYIDLNRAISKQDAKLHQGIWGQPCMGHNIEGKTVGLIGFGAIGQRFAEILKPFHCRLLAYDPFFDENAGKRIGTEKVNLDQLLKESDCISLHVPATSETKGMVNERFLAKMKNSAFLINTSRGALVEEPALRNALLTGTIAGAALDVYINEPLCPQNTLKDIPNLIMTPHIGSATQESFLKAGLLAAENVRDVLNGKTPQYCVN